MANFSKEKLDKIWEKGTTIKGKDPKMFRTDKFGNEMYKPSYGKVSQKGWEVDHSKPKSKGGSNHLNNLQPMNPKANRSKGNSY
ncbi:MAG: HNH endonuclease signature motif containing protein [Bacteroidales bacterium]|jgi:5-methylcytosine-specific restriction endonuclease McrA|nr:HNH endonuclease signature motif containing protein [Bacteroidales bacterium]